MNQTESNLTSKSALNVERMTKQNKRLYEYLLTGQPINVFSQAKRDLRIGFLKSRVSELINDHKVEIKKQRVRVPDVDGVLVSVVEYRMVVD